MYLKMANRKIQVNSIFFNQIEIERKYDALRLREKKNNIISLIKNTKRGEVRR